jgi:hypothetical protein
VHRVRSRAAEREIRRTGSVALVQSAALSRANNARRGWPRAALLAGWRHLRAQVLSARPFRFLRPAAAEPSCASHLPALPPPNPRAGGPLLHEATDPLGSHGPIGVTPSFFVSRAPRCYPRWRVAERRRADVCRVSSEGGWQHRVFAGIEP